MHNYLDSNFILINNINLGVAPYNSGSGWKPIGADLKPFTGSFNGAGHKLTTCISTGLPPIISGYLVIPARLLSTALVLSIAISQVNIMLAAWQEKIIIIQPYRTVMLPGRCRDPLKLVAWLDLMMALVTIIQI